MEPLLRPDAGRVECIELAADKADIYIKRGRVPALDCDRTPELSALRCGVWHIRLSGGDWGIIYIPEELRLFSARIRLGSGMLDIERLSAADIDIRTGAGNIKANSLRAGIMHIEIGSGTGELTAEPERSAFFECGMGSMDIRLAGGAERYRLRTERGIGRLTVFGRETARSFAAGSGECEVFARCGMGKMSIDKV